MKNFKKIASAIAALSLAACMVAPVATMTSFADEPTYTITIQEETDGYTYAAYQIFKGTLGEGSVLGDIKWADELLTDDGLVSGLEDALKTVSGLEAVDLKDAVAVSKKLTDDNSAAFAEAIVPFLETAAAGSSKGADGYVLDVTTSGAGYYLVKNTSVPNSGAYTSYILKVLGTERMEPKSVYPTVDKQVFDLETATDNDVLDTSSNTTADSTANVKGWGETADHAINEKFDFKLIATLPADENYAAYDKYTIQFNDTMSSGVTFDAIKSISIGGKEIQSTDFESKGIEVTQSGQNLTVLIKDVKTIAEASSLGTADLKVEVVYTAHLNEGADVVNTTGATTNNENTVDLWYSNNPNVEGKGKFEEGDEHGETPEDSVWVFSYKVEGKKVDADNTSKYLKAGFTLYDSEDNVIPLYKAEDTNTYFVYDDVISAAATKAKLDGSTSQIWTTDTETTNPFTIKGLDVGVYTLKETDVPAGYNKCEDITITIKATEHKEDTNGSNPTVTLDKAEDMNQTIKNAKGATLPSTGGIGTTLFYLGGGALVAVAGVMLITKKRMTKE